MRFRALRALVSQLLANDHRPASSFKPPTSRNTLPLLTVVLVGCLDLSGGIYELLE